MLPKYKDIMDLIKKGSTLEAQEKIIELREAALELQEENINLKEEINNLKQKLLEEKTFNFDGDVYWYEIDDKKDGPFCPTCNDTKELKVRLHKDGPGWWCKGCSTHFGEHEEYEEQLY